MPDIRIEPASILLFGVSKTSKSTAFIKAFGPKCFWIVGERGALNPATQPDLNPWRDAEGKIVLPRNVAKDPTRRKGGSLDYVNCLATEDAFGEVRKAIDTYLIPGINEGFYGAVVIEGMTDWVERIWAPIGKNISSPENAHGKGYSNKLYPMVKGIVRDLLSLGLWTGAVAHEKPPGDFEGRKRRGQPNLVGDLGASMPGAFDMVLRATIGVYNGKRDRLIHCDTLDPSWITGERFGVCPPVEPTDMRKIIDRVKARQRGEHVELPVPQEGLETLAI